jgi:hypothetical protein
VTGILRDPPATYLYCLVQSERAPSVKGAPESVPGAGPVRALAIDRGVWAIAADAPLDRFSPDALHEQLRDIEAISRHALAHAAVIEFFFRKFVVIPLKMFTLFSSDVKAREQLVGTRGRLTRLFKRLRGLEEWGVRIAAGEAESEAAAGVSTGKDYLRVKKRLHADAAAPPRATTAAITRSLNTLSRRAAGFQKDAFPPPRKGKPYVAGASYLVAKQRRGEWRKSVSQVASALSREGHRLELSGPWPPYRFVS